MKVDIEYTTENEKLIIHVEGFLPFTCLEFSNKPQRLIKNISKCYGIMLKEYFPPEYLKEKK